MSAKIKGFKSLLQLCFRMDLGIGGLGRMEYSEEWARLVKIEF